ncbi:hypothetical protein UMZ34_17000 [Halopseudomonas pachastrellae]|nr:hypothetical protein UMZ34_17000 [Halopseudomonas pachastrellae]
MAQVFDNPAQLKDWEGLYSLDLDQLVQSRQQLSLEQLLIQPKYRFLMLDTRHFSDGFKTELLASIENLDEKVMGFWRTRIISRP